MGGIFRPFDRYGIRLEAGDHNLVSDADASAVSLTAAFPILYVPLDVTFRVALAYRPIWIASAPATTSAAPWRRSATCGGR